MKWGYQPRFSLFMAQLNPLEVGITTSQQKTKTDNQEGKQLVIPTQVKIKQCPNSDQEIKKKFKEMRSTNRGIYSLLFSAIKSVFGGSLKELTDKIADQEIFVSVGPEEHSDGNSFYSTMTSHQDVLFVDNKKVGKQYKEWFKKQPHLLDHTTFQFVFLNDIVMSANAQFLGIKYDKEKDQFILPYKTFINHSPGNLYYRWEMEHITIKCEVKTTGTFSDPYNPMKVLGSFSWTSPQFGGAWSSPGGGTGPTHAGGASLSWNIDKNSSDEVKKTAKKKKQPKEDKTNQKIFDKFRKDLDKSIDPSMIDTQTVNFNYSLGEFFNRLTDPVFFYRVYISQLLYNKLEKWCNGKSEILGLPLQWEDLASWTQGSEGNNKDTRKLGKWRWSEVLLEGDINFFFTDIMEKGYFLDGGDKMKNPNLGMEVGRDYVRGAANAWDITVAEEHWKEKKEEKVASGAIKEAIAGHGTYFRTDNSSTMSELKAIEGTGALRTGHGPFHWDSDKGWCWGCMAGDASQVKNVGMFTPSQDCQIEFILINSQQSYKQVANCKAGVNYEVIVKKEGDDYVIYFKSIHITRESYFVEKKTKTQEIDQEQLDNEVDAEIENLEGEIEDENEIEKESGADGIGDGLEKEREREKEWEFEQENEAEKEQEVEKENETEKETEQEKKEEEIEKKEDETEKKEDEDEKGESEDER